MARGIAAAEKASNEAGSSGGGGFLRHFNLKDKETAIVRFLTDELITCSFYDFVIDREGKPQTFIEPSSLDTEWGDPDPSYNGFDPIKKFGGKCREYGTNNMIDAFCSRKTIGLVVLQEEAARQVDGKMKVGYQDIIDMIEVDGKKYPARQFQVVKQGYKNFWVQVIGYHHEYGTLTDRPYKITRRGGKNDTSYQIIPKDPDPDHDIKAFQESYGYGVKQEDDDDERFLYCSTTLDEWAEDLASEKRARRLLVGDSDGKSSGNGSSANGADGTGEFHKDTTSNPEGGSDEAQAAPPPPSREMDSLRERLGRGRK